MIIKDFPRGEVERSQRDKFYHSCLTQLSHTTLEIEMCDQDEPWRNILLSQSAEAAISSLIGD